MNWKEIVEQIRRGEQVAAEAQITSKATPAELKQQELKLTEEIESQNPPIDRAKIALAYLDPLNYAELLAKTRAGQTKPRLSSGGILINRLGVYDKLIEIRDQIWEGKGMVTAVDKAWWGGSYKSNQSPWERKGILQSAPFGGGNYGDLHMGRQYSQGTFVPELVDTPGYRLSYMRLLKPGDVYILVSELIIAERVHNSLTLVDNSFVIIDGCVNYDARTTITDTNNRTSSQDQNIKLWGYKILFGSTKMLEKDIGFSHFLTRKEDIWSYGSYQSDERIEGNLVDALTRSCKNRLDGGWTPSKLDQRLDRALALAGDKQT